MKFEPTIGSTSPKCEQKNVYLEESDKNGLVRFCFPYQMPKKFREVFFVVIILKKKNI